MYNSGFKNTNVGKIAVQLGVVEPVADHKLIGNFKTDKLGVDVDHPAIGLIQQDAQRKRCGIALFEPLQEVIERPPTVDDIFDHQHVLSLNGVIEVLKDPDHTGA